MIQSRSINCKWWSARSRKRGSMARSCWS